MRVAWSIEDDRELAEAIAVGLRRERLAVDVASTGQAGLERPRSPPTT